jgi:GMP synthase (glutamine-hydrolysing)
LVFALGAQLIAHALGAYAGHQKEIGWGPLSLRLRANQVLSGLLNNVHVLHWHGDTLIFLKTRCY